MVSFASRPSVKRIKMSDSLSDISLDGSERSDAITGR